MSDIKQITLPNGTTYDIKDAVARQQIADIASAGLTYQIVAALPTASSSTKGVIYMVAHTHGTSDGYDEYLTIEKNSTYSWEKIGSTDIDLTGYAKNGDLVGLGSATAANSKTGITISNHTVTHGKTSTTLYYKTTDVLSPELLDVITAEGTEIDYSVGQAVTDIGDIDVATFVQSYSGATKKLKTVSITGTNGTATVPNVTGNETVTIPNVTANSTVTATKISSYGSLPSFTASVANENLTLSFSAGEIPTGSDVTATNTTLGTALTATKTTLGTAFTVAKAASSATTVATGELVDSDSKGGTVMTGLGTATTAAAVTNIGDSTTSAFVTGVSVLSDPTIVVPEEYADSIKNSVVSSVANATSTGASSVTMQGSNSGFSVSAHSVTDNGHTHTVDLNNKTLTVGSVSV